MKGTRKTVPQKAWRKVRVLVEVPVLGDYSEKDLVWDLRLLVTGHEGQRIAQRCYRFNKRVYFGKFEVKEWNKVKPYLIGEAA